MSGETRTPSRRGSVTPVTEASGDETFQKPDGALEIRRPRKEPAVLRPRPRHRFGVARVLLRDPARTERVAERRAAESGEPRRARVARAEKDRRGAAGAAVGGTAAVEKINTAFHFTPREGGFRRAENAEKARRVLAQREIADARGERVRIPPRDEDTLVA